MDPDSSMAPRLPNLRILDNEKVDKWSKQQWLRPTLITKNQFRRTSFLTCVVFWRDVRLNVSTIVIRLFFFVCLLLRHLVYFLLTHRLTKIVEVQVQRRLFCRYITSIVPKIYLFVIIVESMEQGLLSLSQLFPLADDPVHGRQLYSVIQEANLSL